LQDQMPREMIWPAAAAPEGRKTAAAGVFRGI
jgi:hypothetical protein